MHRNLGRNPKTDKGNLITPRVQNQQRDTANRNQRATFNKDDGHRFIWGGAEELVHLPLRDTKSNTYRNCNAEVHSCDERP